MELELRTSACRFAVNVRIQTQGLEAHLHVVERIASGDRSKPPQFIPIRFAVINKLTKADKLLLAFDALVLTQALRCDVIAGKIIHGDTKAVLRVKLLPLMNEARKQINSIPPASAPVDPVLNRHCGECEYQARCRTQAKEKEELSLLGGMPRNERKKLHERGIFTVTQLSRTLPSSAVSGNAWSPREISSLAASACDSRKPDPYGRSQRMRIYAGPGRSRNAHP